MCLQRIGVGGAEEFPAGLVGDFLQRVFVHVHFGHDDLGVADLVLHRHGRFAAHARADGIDFHAQRFRGLGGGGGRILPALFMPSVSRTTIFDLAGWCAGG